MSVDHSLTCDGCKHAYWITPGASVGELRTRARKEGWHVRHGDPDLCPTCLAEERAEMGAYTTRRKEIRTAVKKGAKQADVAREHGITRQRVSQIVKGS
jgi:hypothetical protein